MSDEKKVIVRNGGTSFTILLTITFIVLKLCGVINWSWWLVLLPMLISTGLGLLFLILAIIFIIFAAFNS